MNDMVITSDENLLISHAIGYVFKVLKSRKSISVFKEAFNAIKHGDYDCFFRLIGEPQPELLIQWQNGIIKNSGFSQESGDCDITMLIAINPSLQKFFTDCHNQYGYIEDADITDLIFCKCAAFEIALRVQSNKERQNRNIPYKKCTLEETISELCGYSGIGTVEKAALNHGRQFVNMLKGHKAHFNSWNEGILALEIAWEICNKYNLKICY